MSKEFQRIKERNAVKQQFYDFIAYSSTRAVSDQTYLFILLIILL
jgi:hypothetical protein